jgi:hypothetical protein
MKNILLTIILLSSYLSAQSFLEFKEYIYSLPYSNNITNKEILNIYNLKQNSVSNNKEKKVFVLKRNENQKKINLKPINMVKNKYTKPQKQELTPINMVKNKYKKPQKQELTPINMVKNQSTETKESIFIESLLKKSAERKELFKIRLKNKTQQELYTEALKYVKKGDFKKTIYIWEVVYENFKDPDALKNMAIIYKNGFGKVKKSEDLYRYWYQKYLEEK